MTLAPPALPIETTDETTDSPLGTASARVTYAAFEAFIALPEHDERRFELIDGEIIEKAMPTQLHGLIAARFSQQLLNYTDAQSTLIVRIFVEARHRPTGDDGNDRLPDISVSIGDHPIVEQGVADYISTICIEIQSPDDRLTTMRAKAAFYLTHGARTALVVMPKQRLIEVYSGDDVVILTAEDDLTFPDLLPGFSVPVGRLFP
ncbi:MAG: Uma2 family endonuclease [Chloroflexota bacterium]|nr:Uma2 family endonuclease [Chloroflexota bacterium]